MRNLSEKKMENLDFDDMSTLDMIAGMAVNPGCTPIKFAYLPNDNEVLEEYEKDLSPYLPETNCSQPAFSTPPSILRRGKHRRHRGTVSGEELKKGLHDPDELFNGDACVDPAPIMQPYPAQSLPTTPVRLPYENLPFSPSQFMNSSCESSNSKMTSTPSHASYYYESNNGAKHLTPRSHHSAQQSFSPHTPTPLKHVIAEVERRAQNKTWSPGDLDDLGEVLKECDMGYEPDHTSFEADHTGYEADQSSEFTPLSQSQQSRHKFSKDTAYQRQEKVQKKSMKKIVFTDSPPKETSKAIMLDPAYQKVACGLTTDQLDMIQLARSYYL